MEHWAIILTDFLSSEKLLQSAYILVKINEIGLNKDKFMNFL